MNYCVYIPVPRGDTHLLINTLIISGTGCVKKMCAAPHYNAGAAHHSRCRAVDSISKTSRECVEPHSSPRL